MLNLNSCILYLCATLYFTFFFFHSMELYLLFIFIVYFLFIILFVYFIVLLEVPRILQKDVILRGPSSSVCD